jgi:hypothetical protein
MSKRALSVTSPAPRVIHYLQPTAPAEMLLYTAAHVANQRHERELAYARWAARQAVIVERDRRTRRLLLRIVGVVALVLITGLSALVWMAYRAITTATTGDAAMVGHRCITIVEHRH